MVATSTTVICRVLGQNAFPFHYSPHPWVEMAPPLALIVWLFGVYIYTVLILLIIDQIGTERRELKQIPGSIQTMAWQNRWAAFIFIYPMQSNHAGALG